MDVQCFIYVHEFVSDRQTVQRMYNYDQLQFFIVILIQICFICLEVIMYLLSGSLTLYKIAPYYWQSRVDIGWVYNLLDQSKSVRNLLHNLQNIG